MPIGAIIMYGKEFDFRKHKYKPVRIWEGVWRGQVEVKASGQQGRKLCLWIDVTSPMNEWCDKAHSEKLFSM